MKLHPTPRFLLLFSFLSSSSGCFYGIWELEVTKLDPSWRRTLAVRSQKHNFHCGRPDPHAVWSEGSEPGRWSLPAGSFVVMDNGDPECPLSSYLSFKPGWFRNFAPETSSPSRQKCRLSRTLYPPTPHHRAGDAILTLKEACYHKCPFNFYHFHVCSNNVRGTFKRIQLLCAVGLIIPEFKGVGVGCCFISLTDRLPWEIQLEIWRQETCALVPAPHVTWCNRGQVI